MDYNKNWFPDYTKDVKSWTAPSVNDWELRSRTIAANNKIKGVDVGTPPDWLSMPGMPQQKDFVKERDDYLKLQADKAMLDQRMRNWANAFTLFGSAIPVDATGRFGNRAQAYDTVSSAIGSGLTYTSPLAGALWAGGNLFNKLSGITGKHLGNTNTLTLIVGNAPFIGGIAALFAPTVDTFRVNQDVVADSGGSYNGWLGAVQNANKYAGQTTLGGSRKYNDNVGSAKAWQIKLDDIENTLKVNTMAALASTPFILNKAQIDNMGGIQPARIGKQGLKFKAGGLFNVIPDGALHKNKHHLEDVDEKFEDVTKKGIPVVVEAKNGDLVQQAEVEQNEIILRLDVTKKIEELMKKETDDAAIEAGKLLVKEILHNTVDNTGLLKQVQ